MFPISTYFYLPLGSNIGDSWASSLCLQRKCQCVLPKPSHSHQQSHQPRTELDLGLHSDCDFRFPFGSMHSGQPAHTHESVDAKSGREAALARLHPWGSALTQSSIVNQRSRGKRSHPDKHPLGKYKPIIKPWPFWASWSTQKVRVPAGRVANQALIDNHAQCKDSYPLKVPWTVCAEDEPTFHLRVTTSCNPLSWAKHTRSQGGKWQHYASEHELCKIMHTNTQGRRTSNFFSQLWHILALQHVLTNSLKSSKNTFLALYIPISSLSSFSRKFLVAKIGKITSNEHTLQNIGWIFLADFNFTILWLRLLSRCHFCFMREGNLRSPVCNSGTTL